ncbi:MAG: phosphoadenylyl-sulfate reductase [Parvibaculales bacterium]
MSVSLDDRQQQQDVLTALNTRYQGQTADDVLRAMIEQEFAGRICVVSSFGSESTVLLHKVAQIDPTVPVIFLNTGKLFGETLRYRDRIQSALGLSDVRAIAPHPDDLKKLDQDGDLWTRNQDQCCHIRKVLPQKRALKGFDAVITGRKRFQTSARENMGMIEIEDVETGRLRINPLVEHDLASLNAYIEEHNLPRHPLVKDGYLSIGCMPCTSKVKEGGDYRSGRWAGTDKEECGIHETDFVDGDGI